MPEPDLRKTIEELALEVAGLDYAASQDALRAVYRLAWLTILDDAERILGRVGRQRDQLSALMAGIGRAMQAADQGAAQWVARYMPRAYQAGLRQGVVQFAQQGVNLPEPETMVGLHRGAVQEAARDTMQSLLQATKRTSEAVKERVRQVVQEEVLSQSATGRRADGRRIAQRLAEEGIFGVYDKRGRFIPMEEYARMVSHVKLRETHTKGMEGLMQAHGYDLVQISEHVHVPDICTPWEGKVYSLTGNTPGWPKLPKHTPFHVGCRHVETPFVDTFLDDEEIETLKAKSAAEDPINVYTPEQLEKADAKRAQRERGRKLRKARERKNEAAVASGKKKPRKALEDEIRTQLVESDEPPRPGSDGIRRVNDVIEHGGLKIPVHGLREGTGEKALITEAITTVKPDVLKDLLRIEMRDAWVMDEQFRRGPGSYLDRVIKLSRAYPDRVVWDTEDPLRRVAAKQILWHEVGHLVYDRAMEASDIAEWKKLLIALPEPGREREIFANQFQLHIAAPSDTPLGRFFARFRA